MTDFNAYTGGWSSDGITLPGALDIECRLPISHYIRKELMFGQTTQAAANAMV